MKVKMNCCFVSPTRVLLTTAISQVFVNDPSAKKPLFDTMQLGKDNSIARHGIHGLNWLFSVDVPNKSLKEGENIIFLIQRKPTGPFTGVMYDYLRLEAPPGSADLGRSSS
jgi:rhamnogalacturonan endolyase